MRVVVTTSLGAGPDTRAQAPALAHRLGTVYVQRMDRSLEDLFADFRVEGVVVVGRQRAGLFHRGPEGTAHFFFHPGTAVLRIKNILSGKPDQMIQAMGLQPGDAVLDCTLGLGADAVVAGCAVGAEGRVVGVEKVAPVAVVVEYGLQKYASRADPLTGAAMRRIQVVAADHLDFLRQAPAESFDVVYFDPFFRVSVKGADQLVPLRVTGDLNSLTTEAVEEACRVARRRVVVKERRGSKEFARLGFNQVIGGRYARVAYGVIVK
ncbi:MAG: hypothetical protein C4570_08770 [Ammonifex sp.]|jgi:hypothetical protein|nr:MAG: hypothetical protein C4570_08770 [Ammonifex sp.]